MVAAVSTVNTRSAGVSLARLAEIKQRALAARQAAYAAQPVKQPDGSTLQLCWNGRLHRALMLAEETKRSGDEAKLRLIEQALQRLDDQKRAADAEAVEAETDYMAACAAAGVDAEALPELPCSCAGCVAQQRIYALAGAQAEVRAAVWRLLNAPVGERPEIVAMVERAKDEQVRDQLWRHLKRISDAFLAYESACKDLDEKPNWREVWR